ncbi:hypothetical protein HN011_007682 [Eciton burchellii]|nr:hypothetical protein HN011_007682 [Eciton burchellii]
MDAEERVCFSFPLSRAPQDKGNVANLLVMVHWQISKIDGSNLRISRENSRNASQNLRASLNSILNVANVTIRNQHRMKLRIECEKCKSEQMWNFTTINVVNSPQSRLRCIPHNGRCRFSRVSERENSAQVLIDDSNIPLHPKPFSFADVYECTKAENGFKFTRLDPLGEWMRKTRGNGKFICLKTEDSRGRNHSGSCYRLDRDRFMTRIPVSPGRD